MENIVLRVAPMSLLSDLRTTYHLWVYEQPEGVTVALGKLIVLEVSLSKSKVVVLLTQVPSTKVGVKEGSRHVFLKLTLKECVPISYPPLR